MDVQILDDPELKDSPIHAPPVTKAPSSSLPSQQVPQNLIGNKDLAWERFRMTVTYVDVAACYNMSLKDLSILAFITFSRFAKFSLSSLNIYIYIYNAIEKDTRLNHFQKRNGELSAFLKEAKHDVVVEFKVSKQYTNLLDTNYAAGFEDFRMDAMENFPDIDFSSIKLNLEGAPTSFLLQTSSEDVNIEDDTTTQPHQDG